MKANSVPIKKVARVQSGYAFKSQHFTAKGTRLLRNANIVPGKVCWAESVCIDEGMHGPFDRYRLHRGDVLLSLDRPIISTGIKTARVTDSDLPSLLVQRVGRFLIDRSLIDPDYLYSFLHSPAFVSAVSGHEQSLGVPHISPAQVEAVQIPLPRLDEQVRIASHLRAQLSAVEAARQAADALLQDCDALKRALLAEAFGAAGIAQSWRVCALRDVADVAAGITLGRKTKETELIEVPYVRVANVQDGRLALQDMKTVAATRREIEKWTLQDGDLLLTEGGDLDKLGRGACWRQQLPLCIHQNHIFRVRLPANLYDPDFVSLQVGSEYGKAYFLSHAKKTTGIASINQQVLGSFPLLSPPLAEQQAVAARLKTQLAAVEAARLAAAAQLADISHFPARLLAQAFDVEMETADA